MCRYLSFFCVTFKHTWLSLVMSLLMSLYAVLFSNKIRDLTGSVSEGLPTFFHLFIVSGSVYVTINKCSAANGSHTTRIDMIQVSDAA